MKPGYKLPQTEIARVLVGFKRIFATVGVFSAIINMLLLVPALYMLQVYDRVLASRNETTLLMLTLMIVGAYLLMGSLEFVRSFVLIRVGAQFDMRMNKRIYTAAFEQNLKRGGGNAGQALQDLTIRVDKWLILVVQHLVFSMCICSGKAMISQGDSEICFLKC